MPIQRGWILAAIVAVAFLLRLTAGLSKGPDFVDHGYSFYAEIARTFWDGDGLCYAPGIECAQRMPLYPVLVSPFLASGTAYPWLIVLKAAIGASHALLVYALATSLFSTRVALVAAAAAGANPYAVMHGPSFQDTVVFNVLMTAAVLLLIRSAATRSRIACLAAGLALALAMLTVVRMMLFVPVAVVWVWYAWRDEGWRRQLMGAGLVTVPIVLLMGAWVARNQRVVGAPVLTTEAGLSLWMANNGATMRVLPNRSIDLVEARAWSRLSPLDRQRLSALSDSPVALDRFYARLAVEYVARRPAAMAAASAQKVLVSFVGWLSPARDWPIQIGYLALFAPLNALALIGLWRARHAGPGHVLILLLFASFAATTAIFWAHTSHRSFLHVFKIVYATSVVVPPRTQSAARRRLKTPRPGLSAEAFQYSGS